MLKPEIIENALAPMELEMIQRMVGGFNFPWFWSPRLNSNQKLDKEKLNHCYVFHNFNLYNNNAAAPYDRIFIPLLKRLKVNVLIRIHANMYMHTNKIEEHTDHRDQKFPCRVAILYLNTCNGSTVIKKKHRVMSVANRLVKFKGDWLHHSTSCTDKKRRLVLNVNYI